MSGTFRQEYVIRLLENISFLPTASRAKPSLSRILSKLVPKRSRKRVIRYGILAANVVVLGAVIGFVIRSSSQAPSVYNNNAVLDSEVSISPLDQLSSADIAVSVARLTRIYEATNVTNHADSVNTALEISSSQSGVIVTKPLVVSTAIRSIKDLTSYVTVAGDTVASVASKFGVTSDTVRWSNGLTSNTLPVGKQLWIVPNVSGVVYDVKAGDTAETLATKFHANRDQIIAFNDAEVSGIVAGRKIMIPDGNIQTVTTSFSGYAFGYSAIYGFNGYDFGWCTWWSAKRRADIGRPLPSNLGDAWTWAYRAALAGIPVGDTPAYGAAIMTKSGYPGHVGFVEKVNDDGSAWVSDMNSHGQVSMDDPTPAGGWNHVSWRLVTPDQFSRFKFIY